jgi:hypothetical protein
MWFGYRPITEEGRLLILGMAGVFLLGGFIALYLDAKSPWTELVLAFVFSVGIAGNVIAFWKREDRY